MSRAAPEAIETIRGPVLRASERAGLRYTDRTSSSMDTETTVDPVDDDAPEAIDEPEASGSPSKTTALAS